MKKIILIVIIACSGISCNKDYEITSLFEVKNNSSHIVKLKVFGVYFQNPMLSQWFIDTTYNLPSGMSINNSYILKTDERNSDNDYSNEPFENADSAKIIFDDSLQIIYKPTDLSPRNILKKSSYSGGKSDKRYFKYLYSITDDDYSLAVKFK